MHIVFAADGKFVVDFKGVYRNCGRLGQKRSRKIGLVTDWRPVG